MTNTKWIVASAAMIILVGASTAHAGKRLTTGISGNTTSVQCGVVNVSETKTITVTIRVHDSTGAVVDSLINAELGPLARATESSAGSYRWCEFLVVSGGSSKDLRANMVGYDGAVVVGIEAARDK
jgi:hypothetical protein